MDDHPDPSVRDQLDYGFVARFVSIPDVAHDDIRAMAAAAAADFMTLS
jgi:hypothetical protein